jgi:hypothetical protein
MSPSVPILVALLFAGCSSISMGAADRASLRSATLVEACPLGVPWTRASTRDTENGVAVDFATSYPSNVDELRRRVRNQARVHGPEARRGDGHDGEHGGPRTHGLRLWSMDPVVTNVEDTPAGATLLVAPVDPSRRAAVRDGIARRVAELEAAGCAR